LVAYDSEYPQPLHAKRPVPDVFGVAMVLTPQRNERSFARLGAALTEASHDRLSDSKLETLRSAVPAARSLPLLRLLAISSGGTAILEYLDVSRMAVTVESCR